VLAYTARLASPLANLYLLPVITSALTLGKLSTLANVGIVALCVVVGPVIGVGWALLAAGIHAVLYVFVLTSSINGLCHHVGYKNFDNTATNIRVLALITGGEGLHNNHHGYPRSPKFSFRASEIDPAWPLIDVAFGSTST